MVLGIDPLIVRIQLLTDHLTIALQGIVLFFGALIKRGITGNHFPSGIQAQLFF
jgi:hypothetical protein